jgi:hypothetical protein
LYKFGALAFRAALEILKFRLSPEEDVLKIRLFLRKLIALGGYGGELRLEIGPDSIIHWRIRLLGRNI